MNEWVEKLKNKDRRAFSRLLSLLENRGAESIEILKEISEFSSPGPRLGITGPAGAGKSTLVDQVVKRLRNDEKKVGVLAVDPSSPFTGGAVLGDRIRMQRHSGDPDVYIRSVGSRGKSGGISFATRAFIQLFEAYGVDELILETVGAGQSETAVVNLVDTTVVVLVPEAGDSVQALKAGMLEIADVYVVNKKDRAGAEQIVHEIESMLSLGSTKKKNWNPPVILTQAQSGEGVSELLAAVEKHREYLVKEYHASEQERFLARQTELIELVTVLVEDKLQDLTQNNEHYFKKLSQVEDFNIYALADEVLKKLQLQS